MTKTQKQLQREETHEKLLEAALQEFARKGYEKTSVDDICRAAGYSKGAFYVHFEQKEDIFFTLMERSVSERQAYFKKILLWDGNLKSSIKNLFAFIMGMALKDKNKSSLFVEFYAHAQRNEEMRAKLAVMYKNWHQFLTEIICQGQEAGLLRLDVDPEILSPILFAMADGLVSQAKVAPESVDLEKAAECLAEMVYPYVVKLTGTY